MGENMLKRRNKQFVQQRDACFVEQTAHDLFALCPPETVVQVHAQPLATVREGDEVWCAVPDDDGDITFRLGSVPVAYVDGADAEHLRDVHRNEQLAGRVDDVDTESGIVTIRLGASR